VGKNFENYKLGGEKGRKGRRGRRILEAIEDGEER
jgi:hypothetical protein